MPVPKATEPSDIHNQFHDNDYHNNLLVYSPTNMRHSDKSGKNVSNEGVTYAHTDTTST